MPRDIKKKARKNSTETRQLTRNSILDRNREVESEESDEFMDEAVDIATQKSKREHTVLPKSKLSLYVTPSQESLPSPEFPGFPQEVAMNNSVTFPTQSSLTASEVNEILDSNIDNNFDKTAGAAYLNAGAAGPVPKLINSETRTNNINCQNMTVEPGLREDVETMKSAFENILVQLNEIKFEMAQKDRSQVAQVVTNSERRQPAFNYSLEYRTNQSSTPQTHGPTNQTHSRAFQNFNQRSNHSTNSFPNINKQSSFTDRNNYRDPNNSSSQRNDRQEIGTGQLNREVRLDKWNIKYDGNNMSAEDFIFQIEILREGSPYTLNEVYLNLSQVLTGNMMMFFLRYRKMNPTHGWTQFKISLTDLYGSLETDYSIYTKMTARKQGPKEPFMNFYSDIMQLNLKMRNPRPSVELISIIRNNCCFRIGQVLLNYPNGSMSEIVAKCRETEDFYKRNALAPKSNRFVKELEDGSSEADDPTVEALKFRKNDRYSDLSSIQCLECGAYGHKRATCPNKPNDQNSKFFSYRCGLEGYTFYSCVRCNTAQENRTRSFDATGNRSSTKIPDTNERGIITQKNSNYSCGYISPENKDEIIDYKGVLNVKNDKVENNNNGKIGDNFTLNKMEAHLKDIFDKKIIEYNKIRDRIFKKVSPKILNARHRFAKRKANRTLIESSVLEKDNDIRPFAKVSIFGVTLRGLLDSGANVCALGKGSIEFLEKVGKRFLKFESNIRTASGQVQKIIGKIRASVSYKGKTEEIDFYIVPSLMQELYLGLNFWKLFGIAADIFNDQIEEVNFVMKDPNMHNLNEEELAKLKEVVSQFPSSTIKGLGRTDILTHTIDTGNSQPIKQRHFPYSPAIEKLIYEEFKGC